MISGPVAPLSLRTELGQPGKLAVPAGDFPAVTSSPRISTLQTRPTGAYTAMHLDS